MQLPLSAQTGLVSKSAETVWIKESSNSKCLVWRAFSLFFSSFKPLIDRAFQQQVYPYSPSSSFFLSSRGLNPVAILCHNFWAFHLLPSFLPICVSATAAFETLTFSITTRTSFILGITRVTGAHNTCLYSFYMLCLCGNILVKLFPICLHSWNKIRL